MNGNILCQRDARLYEGAVVIKVTTSSTPDNELQAHVIKLNSTEPAFVMPNAAFEALPEIRLSFLSELR